MPGITAGAWSHLLTWHKLIREPPASRTILTLLIETVNREGLGADRPF